MENALANSSYKPSQTVTDAADALKEWQANRPGDYQSSYQERIDQLLNQLLQRESFQYSYTKDPLYRQYEQNYLQNAHNASADAAAQAAALTGGYGSSYATSAAQQAYQQQIGALSSAIPTLYSLALDTYTSGGNELVSQLDQLNNSEQDAQQQYNNKLSDYYTQLKQKGEAYNNAYAQDYGAYQDYLSQLGTLHDYYSAQEQQQAARRQQVFSNVMTVLGLLGDAADGVLHILAHHHHQISQLVDDNGDVGHLFQIRPFCGQLVERLDVAHIVFCKQAVAALHLLHRAAKGTCGLFRLGDHRHQQVGNAVVLGQLHHLGVDEQELDVLGAGAEQQAHDDAVHAHGFTAAGAACNEQMGHLAQVCHLCHTGNVLTKRNAQR